MTQYKTRYILAVRGDSCWVPQRFWSWEILSEEELERRAESPSSNNPHPYHGSCASIPTEVKHKIEEFEKRIGYALRRPSASGDHHTMIG